MFDETQRVKAIQEIDGIVRNTYDRILLWSAPSVSIAYWNKFGMPPGTLARAGDEFTTYPLWWLDPDKDAKLQQALRDSSIKLDGQANGRSLLARLRKEGAAGPAMINTYPVLQRFQSSMTGYFARRFLLIIPTFIGITMAVFLVMNFVPGGPVERQIMRYKMAAAEGGAGGARADIQLPAEAVEELRHYYGFDKPVYTRYGMWIWNLAHLNLGRSYVYQDPVWNVITARLPVTLFLGFTGFFLSYLVCIPLGVFKAIRHGSRFDLLSSLIVFLGYSIPGWALGTALLVLLGGGSFWNVFPLGGFRPADWEYLSFFGKVVAQIHYMFLPVLCYMIESFATLTILMKNSLMENLGQDYIRTAYAKGLSERRVIFVHALRNSLIPIATGLGTEISIILAGSFLIEKVFNIDGMGYLGYTSILQRDYPVALGILVISSLLLLIGNILSDMIYVLVDPRIRFK